MERKIALLRGINVGGKRKVLMKDLKRLFEGIGAHEVSTYIQSGNVIFRSEGENVTLEKVIESAIKEAFGFEVHVLELSASTLAEIANKNPFLGVDEKDISALHLTLFQDSPSEEAYQTVLAYQSKIEDRFELIDNAVYIYCSGKYHQSKLSNSFFESKLKTKATTRNWKTILKLVELSSENE